jgi:hypothetical protein
MLKTSLAALTVLLLAASAHAEQGSAPAAPPPAAVEATPPPRAAAGVPPAFMAQFLSYDEDAGVVVQGRARQPLAREDLYVALDRPDLIEKSRAAARRRVILGVAAGVVLVGGVTTAVIARVGLPNSSVGACNQTVRNFNDACAPDLQNRYIISAAGLIGGISLGGLLGMLAYMSSPDVLSKDETSQLISQHNGSLLRRLRSEGSLRVTPYASAQGAGVVTVVAF